MDRRRFLEVGATSGLTLAATPHGAAANPERAVPRPGPVPDMDAYLARVDAGMARIGAWSVTAAVPNFAGDSAETDALARSALQALFLTGMIGDLPLEQQFHPGMQERAWAAVPLMDDALERMDHFIGSRSGAELARAQAALRGGDVVADRVADALDREAALSGVSAWRRQQLRGMVRQAAWRLANQPPELLIDEYRDKISKVDGSDIAAELRRRIADGRVSERIFWDRAPAGGVVSAGDVVQRPRTQRERRIARGSRAMGIGLLIFLGSVGIGVIGGENSDGTLAVALIGGTVGAIWFLIGFLILLAGLATPGNPGATGGATEPPR